MKCCPQCFTDAIARSLVTDLAHADEAICDLCGSKCERLLEIRPESELAGQFSELLSVFSTTVEDSVAEKLPRYDSLFEAFSDTWAVFRSAGNSESALSSIAFNQMIRAMFPEDNRILGLLEGSVYLDPSPSASNPFELGFFGDKDWYGFSEEIKHVHRYHAKIANTEVLERLLNALARVIGKDDGSWYRARRWNNKGNKPPTEDDLKEPKPDRASDGRMSPSGVSCLYISNDAEGAMAEIRASRHDDIAIMEMKPTKELRILDLSRVAEISPFDETVDCKELASNLENLKQIKEALIKPMRSTDNVIEYIPTQYIADFARSIGFDGIGYNSVLHENSEGPAYNIASFLGFDRAFKCQSITLCRIENVNLEASRLKVM